jgi:Leishmanolysin
VKATLMNYLRSKWIVALALCANLASAQAAFTINLTFSGLDAAQQSYFTEAKTFWETAITGYQPGILLTGFAMTATGSNIDGVGGILGSAGPDSAVSQGGFRLTTSGSMLFDTSDITALIAQGSFGDVIRHEMAHVIGFGTLWTQNNVYVDGTGHFTGAAALAQYKTEFIGQGAAAYVPIELGGGGGTADGHWNEVDGGGSNTGIVDAQGHDFKNELMTGWLNAPTFTSRTTIASFQDIGYVVNLSAVPEPEAVAMFVFGLPLMMALAARRKRKAAGC